MIDRKHATNRSKMPETSGLDALEGVLKEARTQTYPPVERWSPSLERDIGLRVDRRGIWTYQNSPIRRSALVKLFASVLCREDDGRYALVTPVEKIWLDVEIAPLLAVEMTCMEDGGQQILMMRTNVDDQVIVDQDHPIWIEEGEGNGEPRPFVRVRGRIDALLSRSLYYELVGLAVPGEGGEDLGVWSAGQFFPLGRAV